MTRIAMISKRKAPSELKALYAEIKAGMGTPPTWPGAAYGWRCPCPAMQTVWLWRRVRVALRST